LGVSEFSRWPRVRQPAGDLPASAGSSEGQALPEDFDRRIVKTAELGIEVDNVREGAAEAQQVAARFDGSVLSSQIEGDDWVSADLVLTVPSQEFEGSLKELRKLGKKITTDAARGEDVTEEFVDLKSRERNLVAAGAKFARAVREGRQRGRCALHRTRADGHPRPDQSGAG